MSKSSAAPIRMANVMHLLRWQHHLVRETFRALMATLFMATQTSGCTRSRPLGRRSALKSTCESRLGLRAFTEAKVNRQRGCVSAGGGHDHSGVLQVPTWRALAA